MNIEQMRQCLINKEFDALLCDLYGGESYMEAQRKRYIQALKCYLKYYGNDEAEIYSAPGRSEVGGNHTDHQHGRVLAAAINLDAVGIVSKQEHKVKIISDGFDFYEIDLDDLEKKEEEIGTSQALVRGILYKFKEAGYCIGGFKAYIISDVLVGAGLSSSAAFEVLIAAILSGLYNRQSLSMVALAKISQYAENVYFKKPCGLMDQCACAVGSLISIDFKDPLDPIVEAVHVDFSVFHHSLCIVDTKGSHSNLTDEYAAIPLEMGKAAQLFGKDVLREVNEEVFFSHIKEVREKCGDRAVLRAFHFFSENRRVEELVKALKESNFDMFKKTIALSSDSSFKYLQNIYSNQNVHYQGVSIALALSQHILKDHGVCRVHGGGFAGTIQAFVEDDYVEAYQRAIEKIFGKGSCRVLKVRKYGGCRVL